jgi:predicted acetyltransferase
VPQPQSGHPGSRPGSARLLPGFREGRSHDHGSLPANNAVYWTDSDRKAFLFQVEGALAGFALVFAGEPRDIAEFFVMRKYRGRKVGTQAAASLFDQFPGRWTVRQQLTNPAATAFWRKAIRFPFQEHVQSTEIVQSFTTAGL